VIRLERIIWVRADSSNRQDIRKRIVTTALENNLVDIVIKPEDAKIFEKLGKLNLILIQNNKIKKNDKAGEFIEIKSKTDQANALKLAGKTDYVVVSTKNWKVIPVENLIAGFQKTKTKLLVEVADIKYAELFFTTLEVGVDGIVINPTNPKKLLAFKNYLDGLGAHHLTLVNGKITKIKSIATGDRVCIDTCSMLKIGEGMLVGSQANGLFLVHSESVESEYVETRPFRVNAGPVHSYILTPNDKTRYLSELKVGDEVLVVDNSGNTRSVVIGRVKIEKRPLILVEVKFEQKSYNIILQNAETIRLISDGKPKSIVDLKLGDTILIWVDTSARHFGMKVKESIVEK